MNKREKNIWLRLIDKKIHETCGSYEGLCERVGSYKLEYKTPEDVQDIIFNTIFDINATNVINLNGKEEAQAIAILAFNDSKFIRKLPDRVFFPRECLVYEDEEEKQRSINEQLAWRAQYRKYEVPLIIETWHKEYKSFNELLFNYYEDIYTQKALDMAKDSKEFAKFSNTTKECLKLLKYRIAIAKSISNDAEAKFVKHECTDCCHPWPLHEDKDL